MLTSCETHKFLKPLSQWPGDYFLTSWNTGFVQKSRHKNQ